MTVEIRHEEIVTLNCLNLVKFGLRRFCRYKLHKVQSDHSFHNTIFQLSLSPHIFSRRLHDLLLICALQVYIQYVAAWYLVQDQFSFSTVSLSPQHDSVAHFVVCVMWHADSMLRSYYICSVIYLVYYRNTHVLIKTVAY